MLVFLIMFLLAFAQIVTDSSSKENSKIFAWRLYGCGLPAALTAFLICVPKVFLVLTGHPELIVEGYGIEICDLALAVFIPVFLYNTATAKKSA